MSSRRDQETVNNENYFLSYDQFHVHELMLRDRSRVAAYHDAMMDNKELFQDKVVLDVGSGSGILSMFAVKAGAKKVYAVDACPTICRLAQELIKCNHFQDRIEVINKRVEEINEFDHKIDIIVSEWMGFYLFHESMLESVIYARDKFLSGPTESIIMFPSHAYVYCAPFIDQKIRIESNGMWKNYFDLNMTPILSHMKNSDLSECVIETIESSQLVHEPQLIQSIDLRTVQSEEIRSMTSSCQFEIDNTCIISGFSFWFDCYFPSTSLSNSNRIINLSTSPYCAATHWKQTLIFFNEDIYPLKGDVVNVNIQMKQSSENHRQYALTIDLADTDQEPKFEDERLSPSAIKRPRENISTDEESSSDDDEQSEEEHPIPCDCDRPRCKLIRAIMDKFEEENVEE